MRAKTHGEREGGFRPARSTAPVSGPRSAYTPPWAPASVAFANRLVAARKHAGLTQNALAETAGLYVSNIRRYEAGTNQPTIDALRNLALALATST